MQDRLEDRWPASLLERVGHFLFQAHQWVNPQAFIHQYTAHTGVLDEKYRSMCAQIPPSQWPDLIAKIAPIKAIDSHRICQDWRSRLVLLPESDWLNLGLMVSVLPLRKNVHDSMDGHFRRVLRQHFSLDSLTLITESEVPESFQTLSPAGSWRNPDQMSAAGVRAVWDHVQDWDAPVRTRCALRFDPWVLDTPSSVTNLTSDILEVACKITFQDHPWLWL